MMVYGDAHVANISDSAGHKIIHPP